HFGRFYRNRSAGIAIATFTWLNGNQSRSEAMGITKRNGGEQKGAQDHGEGQHGDKTRDAIAAAWNHPGIDETAGGANVAHNPEGDENGSRPTQQEVSEETHVHAPPSGSHLVSGRTQHDDADLNSEKTRQVKDAEKHKHIAGDEWSQKSARASAKRKS
ncbi:MAG: hypothetical protein ACR2M1_02775, partial [Gemmatimonadaceae bacterium]